MQQTLPGRIIDTDGNLLADTEIALDIIPPSGGRLGEWSGHCEIENVVPFMKSATLRLELSDGRSGDIIVSRITGTHLRFQGSGPLQ